VKQTLLALSAIAALSATSIATAYAQNNYIDPGRHVYDYQRPSGNDYYDSGCHTVISHHVTASGEGVTNVHRTCF
jgi:hypothetical protein